LSVTTLNGLLHTEKTFNNPPGNWTLNAGLGGVISRLDPEAIEEFILIFHYSVA